MALKDLVTTPAQSASYRLKRYARERVNVMRRAWDNDGRKALSPWRFRLQEAELFRREIDTAVSKLID